MNTTNTQNQTTKQNEQEIGALWKRTSKTGSQTYLSGHITVDELGSPRTYKVVVFSNRNKKNEKAPDFRIYLSRGAAESSQSATAKRTAAPEPSDNAQQSVQGAQEDLI
jgi:uncharacterized protein (DUF736 family)